MQNLNIPNANFGVIDNFIADPSALLNKLITETDWQQFVLGNGAKSPRLNKTYGAAYTYSGKHNPATAIPDFLMDIANAAAEAIGYKKGYFNQVLLNYYRDGSDSISRHSDNEPELGKNPRVASISLGAVRDFYLVNRFDSTRTYKIPLRSGQLLAMGKNSQLNYMHYIPKDYKCTQPRVSITLRHIEV